MNAEQLRFKFHEPIKVLDHGYVRFIDCMGDDNAIAQSARVSYEALDVLDAEEGKRTRGLIRYLLRHRHTTPFEMCELKLGIKMPMSVGRQHNRHRTSAQADLMASTNEVSSRYKTISDEMYVPAADEWRLQARDNKQGSSGVIEDLAVGESLTDAFLLAQDQCLRAYKLAEEQGVAKELARDIMPLGTYTEMIWKIDLHNLLHYLALRMDSHAQHEIRMFANAIGDIVKAWVPLAWEAFEDYHPMRGGQLLSRMEANLTRHLLSSGSRHQARLIWRDLTEREQKEYRAWLTAYDPMLEIHLDGLDLCDPS